VGGEVAVQQTGEGIKAKRTNDIHSAIRLIIGRACVAGN
jgi:hypothetical protein